MKYDKELPGCFGVGSQNFAWHPADEDRAFEWLTSLRLRNIGFKAASEQIEGYLKSEGASADHIRSQLNIAARYLKPWLLD